MSGIANVRDQLRLTHWCAIMEPFLLRLLQMNAIHFIPVGPLVDYHGLGQPSYGLSRRCSTEFECP